MKNDIFFINILTGIEPVYWFLMRKICVIDEREAL